MNNLEALVCLHAANGWLWLPVAPDGRVYGPGFFKKRNWVDALFSMKGDNRRVSQRLMAIRDCLRCQSPIAEGSTGDHLVAKSQGGPDGAANYLPLCKSCNLSKGKKDLFAWWSPGNLYAALEKPVLRDILCSYARLMLFVVENNGALYAPASSLLLLAVESTRALMSPRHYEAMTEAVRQQAFSKQHARTS